jgi:predicted amidohydrolase
MRLLLAELAPVRGDPDANLARIEAVLAGRKADLAIFPELFLTGYRVGDRLHRMGVSPGDATMRRLGQAAAALTGGILVGGATTGPRPGEIHNAAILVRPDGSSAVQLKRYLPTYGPFEEGVPFSPGRESNPLTLGNHRIGVGICYDTFFPELFRSLALAGAELLAIPSASPVTSRRLFEKLLPARAVENAAPLAYVNRVGVEDGVVFGGGSGLWDARGEPLQLEEATPPAAGDGERLLLGTVDLEEAARWRPFRPVLRDMDRG